MVNYGIKYYELLNQIINLQDAKTIFDKIPGSQFTNGGFIKFGPDGKNCMLEQELFLMPLIFHKILNSLAGKILRLNDDGTIPEDNPWENSPVYSLGHRNPQGMTWDDDGNMFWSELGPKK